MAELLDKLLRHKFDRRTFLKGTATMAAGLSMAGYGADTLLEPINGAKSDETLFSSGRGVMPESDDFVPVPCWHNCGGKCLNKALIKDGVVIRQKTDDLEEDTPDAPQQRACVRGRNQQHQVFGADRLKYPMKRKNWQPGGGVKELRGQDEWERISWDEALDIMASEIKRISDTYGVSSILSTAGDPHSLLTQMGSYVRNWGTTSWGTWYATPHLLGIGDALSNLNFSLNDRLDMQNCEVCVAFGINPAWSALGNATNFLVEMKRKGCKFIFLDPVYNDTMAALDAQWIPIRPGTDSAMLLALAYTMLEEDDPKTNPLIDWDMLNRCAYGFDAEHMPPDAREKENFKDYLLGKYDSTPKTPEWASKICGADPKVIRELARKMGKNTKLALLMGWASARTFNADSLPQLLLTVGIMGGHIGKSGHTTGPSCWNYSVNLGPRLVMAGGNGVKTDHPTHPFISVNDTELWPVVLGQPANTASIFRTLNGSPTGWKNSVAALNLTQKAPRQKLDIQMIWHSSAATLQTREGMKKGIEAHRKVEFVVSQSHFLTTNSKYADLVLPVTTEWEREGGNFLGRNNRDVVFVYQQVVKPLYEARDDEWIVAEVAKRLGYDPDKMFPLDRKQRFFNSLKGATVVKENGKEYEPLVTITQEDIDEWGVEGTPQEGRVPLKKLLADGKYQVRRYQGDNYGHIAYANFVKDPEANPLYSTTGKFEIYSQTLADVVNSQGFTEISPLPKYIAPECGYESTFTAFSSKEKGEYPYQCINLHYQRRAHSIFDNIPVLRETFANPFYVSAQDAKEKGIQNGDTVLVSSEYGQVLRPAYVTERMMPGVVSVSHGAWVDVDERTGVDKAGADNYLCGNIATGLGVSGWNTHRVNFERWNGESLPADKDVPQRIVF